VAVRRLVEAELARRGMASAVDLRSGRLIVAAPDGNTLMISLQNLERIYASQRDPAAITAYVDALLTPAAPMSADGLAWLLEPNSYEPEPPVRQPVTPRLDRVLAHVAPDGSQLTWVGNRDVESLGMDVAAASDRAYANLDRELRRAEAFIDDRTGVPVMMLETAFPAKASLLLAPALRQIAAPRIGWPVLAIAPDRDFVLLWNADFQDFVQRVSAVVAREHRQAPYPLSLEVFHLDEDVRALGEFTA